METTPGIFVGTLQGILEIISREVHKEITEKTLKKILNKEFKKELVKEFAEEFANPEGHRRPPDRISQLLKKQSPEGTPRRSLERIPGEIH